MENLNVRKSVSKRGKELLFVNNFRYCFAEQLASGEKKWRCRTPKCSATIYTMGEDNLISRCNLNHAHPELVASVIQKQFLVVAAKRKATEELNVQPKRIVQSLLTKCDNSELTIGDLKSVKRSIYAERRKTFPSLPKNIKEVFETLENMKSEISTNREEEFLIVNDSNHCIVIFSCMTNLEHLCKCKKIFMDGTFKYSSKYFVQLFTIHGQCNGHYIPLVFCLLKDKTSETYKQCLKFVSKKCEELSLQFRPAEVVIDFEMSIHKAVNSMWHNIKIIGCRFHISQAWWRKIQELGLTKHYKEKTDIGKWIGYCFGLLFLEPDDVGDCFVFDLLPIAPENDKIQAFMDYLVETYIEEDSTFPPEIWAAKCASSSRTTNACESFHSHLNKSFNFYHPNIFVFLEVLRQYQAEIYVQVQSVNKHRQVNTHTQKRENFLKEKIEQYNKKELTALQYVKLVSHYYSF